MQDVLVIIDKFLPFLYVLAGGALTLLTPWASERAKRINRKRDLKYEFISSVYTYFTTQKTHVICNNYQSFFSRRVSIMMNSLNQNLIQLNIVDEAKYRKLLEFFTASEKEQRIKVESTYEKLVEIESKCLALASEVSEFYNSKKGEMLFDLVHKAIEDGNNPNKGFLYNYAVLDNQQLDNITAIIADQLTSKNNELQVQCTSLIKTINETLK